MLSDGADAAERSAQPVSDAATATKVTDVKVEVIWLRISVQFRFPVSFSCVLFVCTGLSHASPASQKAYAYETLKIKAMIGKEEYMIGPLKVGQGETTLHQACKDFLGC